MRLGADGSSNLAGTCGVGATGLLDDAFAIRTSTAPRSEWIEELAGERGHMFVWDWRKDPREVTPLLDAAIDSSTSTRRR